MTSKFTSLQCALGVVVLRDFIVTCSYDEVLRFESSARGVPPIRTVRKRLHINFQIFLGEDHNPPPPICHPSPNYFLQKRLHIKKPLGTSLPAVRKAVSASIRRGFSMSDMD